MSLEPLRPLYPDTTLPLLVEPQGDPRVETLLSSLNPDAFAEPLRRAGALLFRGWDVQDPAAFEKVARAIAPNLQNEYLGTSPRNALTPYVFTASELPGFFPIPQHCEMTFVRHPPHRLFFVCLVPNRAPGGETPLVDFRKVWKELDANVRERFATKGVKIIRNYAGPKGGAWWDPWKLKRWDEMFGTTDREVVTRRCLEEGFEPTWGANGTLRLVSYQPAMKAHPDTGEIAWFNHSQVFHRDAVPPEYDRIAGRLGMKWKAWGIFARSLLAFKRRVQDESEVAMHTTFGDGTEISLEDMEAVREVIWKNMVAFPWQKGDILAIDNDSVAHGRLPYRGERLVAVSWA